MEFCLWNAMLGNTYGLLLGNLVRGVKTIVQVIAPFFVPFIILAGFLVNMSMLQIICR